MLFIKYVINRISAVVLPDDACGERGGWGRHASDADRRSRRKLGKVLSMTSI